MDKTVSSIHPRTAKTHVGTESHGVPAKRRKETTAMFTVLRSTWALLLGMFMLMIGNGMQGSLLGLRGAQEGFTTFELSIVMSAYFVGFLFASRTAPVLIQRVGHIRVFSALGSMISAVLILYPALAEPWAWILGRVVIGFCFCGVYITAESWLNAAADNENRGKALSLYMVAQMGGIVLAQYVIVLGDVGGFILFIVPSILVSMSFAPILLSTTTTTPHFERVPPLPLTRLIAASPLACVGMLLLGSVFAGQFGMTAVYGSRAGLTVGQISFVMSMTYLAALVLQFPIGWLSDRMDRRKLILILAAAGGVGAALSFAVTGQLWLITLSSMAVGVTSNTLYAILIAYANDYLDGSEMAGASGGLLFLNGLGAIAGPFAVGWMMDAVGVHGFWLLLSVLMLAVAVYALWRMRAAPNKVILGDKTDFAPIAAQATQVATGALQGLTGDRPRESANAA
jgi:MFS family permease